MLVVEDEHDIATFLRAYFRATGQDVVHVDPTSPEQVADAVSSHHPACVLLDLNLRGFNGLAAYREIRRSEANAFVPVIIVTADHSPRSRRVALERGVDAFVTKPFKVKELCESVVAHVERAARMAEASRPDEVTGVASSAYLQTRLAGEVALDRRAGRGVALALVRVCSAVDDGAMRDVAERLVTALPDDAVLARNADAEFGVILPATDATSALARIEDAVAAASGAHYVVRAGLASFPDHAADRDELYMAADVALADACDGDRAVAVAV